MQHISAHIVRAASRARKTERGEMMKYFCEQLNRTRIKDGLDKISMPRMGKVLEDIPTKDLYYLKRVCDDSSNFSKRFWYELNPKKHNETREGRKEDTKQ